MEFVYMKHPTLETLAKFPESAVPHWESYGWQRTDPPEKPPRARARVPERVRAERPTKPTKSTGAAGVSDTNPVSGEKSAATARPKTPKSAPRREED